MDDTETGHINRAAGGDMATALLSLTGALIGVFSALSQRPALGVLTLLIMLGTFVTVGAFRVRSRADIASFTVGICVVAVCIVVASF